MKNFIYGISMLASVHKILMHEAAVTTNLILLIGQSVYTKTLKYFRGLLRFA